MKLRIDTDGCTGHGRCYAVAPDLVTDDDRGYGEVIGDGAVLPEHVDQAERAVRACPERAITLSDEE